MARPRTFNPDEVLLIARDVFWKQGYQNTSLDDITAATGLTKPSLYAAFGDKASLFRKVLDRYHAEVLEKAARVLESDTFSLTAIATWLASLPPIASYLAEGRGCLSVNASTDGSLDNPSIRGDIAAFNEKLEALVRERLEQDRARLAADFDPSAAAHTVTALYLGLMVMAKQKQRPEIFTSVISQVPHLLC